MIRSGGGALLAVALVSVELVDRGGKTIERVTRRSSWEGEARAFDFDVEILECVVPMIARVNLRLEAPWSRRARRAS